MRIGILTFHYAHNYGAVLQAYALQYRLESMGHEVYFIDYKNRQILNAYKVFNIHRCTSYNLIECLRKTIDELKALPLRHKRHRAFIPFIRHKLHTVPTSEITLNPFDCIIIGSDQVWNTRLTRGVDPYYWGEFKRPPHTLLISYAASMEEELAEKSPDITRLHLNKFDAISVREKTLEKSLTPLLPEKRITCVADPTMLVEKEVWEALACPPHTDEPYLLLYQVRNSTRCEHIANEIAREKRLKVVCLSASALMHNSEECQSASPEEFLGWFKRASFIVCSSFHGTVFSLLFERPFYSIRLNDGKDDRVNNLLTELELTDRFIDHRPAEDTPIDYDRLRDSIKRFIKESMEYLYKHTNQ